MSQRASRANVSTGQLIKKDIIISSCLRLGKAKVLSVFFFNKRRRDYVTFFNERSVVESSIVGNFCVMPFSPSTVKRAVLHAHQL